MPAPSRRAQTRGAREGSHRHQRRRTGFIIVWAALGVGVTLASAHCKIKRFPALRVTFTHGHPTTTALINRRKVLFTIDSGDYDNMIWPAAARRYGLPLNAGSQAYDTRIRGAGAGGGVQVVQQTIVRAFTLLNALAATPHPSPLSG